MSEETLAGHIERCPICKEATGYEQACEVGRALHEDAVRQAHVNYYLNNNIPLPAELQRVTAGSPDADQ